MIDWTKLYVDLLQNGSPDIIVQTLNRIIMHGKMRKDITITNIANDIFTKITQVLSLQYQTIDTFLKGPRSIHTKSNDQNYERKKENTKMEVDGFLNDGRVRFAIPSPITN